MVCVWLFADGDNQVYRLLKQSFKAFPELVVLWVLSQRRVGMALYQIMPRKLVVGRIFF